MPQIQRFPKFLDPWYFSVVCKLLATEVLSRKGIIMFIFCIETSRGWPVASLDGHVKGWRWGGKEASPCFGGLYVGHEDAAVPVGHEDKVSVSPYSNHSTVLEGEEGSGILPCTMIPWRRRSKSTFACRNH